ncbi:MAG: carbohydrate kinase family protein [Gemmataceae bacterium]|nr:carbohydrate kinase family protein [Gemmataceae bacterium]
MRPLVVGAGRVTWDVVFREGRLLGGQAGGTCGNVMAILAWLGWRALPAITLGMDDPGMAIRSDLERFGVDCSHIEQTISPTPVISRPTDSNGLPFFSSRCGCGAEHPSEAQPPSMLLSPEMAASTCRAFFFDQDSEVGLSLALRCREQGALVVWEPSYAGPEVDWGGCLRVAHVLKYSRAQLPGLHERVTIGPRLVIETDGAEGLRYRLDGVWHDSPAFPAPVVRDAGGAGDWTTAGFIAHFAGWDTVGDALRRGQAMAAWSVAFDGARGGMYAATREEFDRETAAILAGEVFDPGERRSRRFPDAGRFCECRASGTA